MEASTIIRTIKDRSHPYTIISRDVFNDERLSWEARGVLGYLLSKPDNWEVRFGDLLKRGPGARDRMRRILHELAAYGYLQRQRTHDAEGKILWITLVYETPQALPSPQNTAMATQKAAPSTPFPATAEPSTAEPSPVNTAIYIVETPPNTDLTKYGERESPPPPSNVFLTDELRLWLVGAVANAGLPPNSIDVDAETAKWEDAQAAGQRPTPPTPKARAADWRIWMARAINWAKAHPQEEHRGSHQPAPTPTPAPVDIAEQRRIVERALARRSPAPPAGGPTLPAM